MAVRPFLMWPDRRLRSAAAPVGAITDAIRAIWGDMIDTMEAMPGVGLAAPQIGVMLRLAVVDCSAERGRAIRMADPEVVSAGPGRFTWEEGSPNLPGVSAQIARPTPVTVAFTDETGARVTRTFEELWGTSVQHQIDHLEGRMYFHRLSATKRDILLRKARRRA
ncbi:MAG: peptide deformylase [Roseicyclus sp.]